MRGFAPDLGPLISSLAHRPWQDLLADPPELARIALQARQIAGATHLVAPLDPGALAAACGEGTRVTGDALDLSGATFANLDDLEPGEVLAASWLAPMLEVARIAGTQARVPLAARLPSPRRLVAEVGGPAGDEDALMAAADLCAAVALELLRAGASLVLVDPADGPDDDDSVAMIALTAAPFNVPVLSTRSAAVVTLDLPSIAAPAAIDRPGNLVLVTSRPVRADDDLGRLRELGMAVAPTGTGSGTGTGQATSAPASAIVKGRASAGRSESTERFSVGIDMGGTFTDAYVTSGLRSAATKVPTIRFDLTRSLVASLRSAAEAMGMDAGAFMRRVAILKVATTIGTNAVIEGTGTRVGVVVGRGHEADLYGPGRPDAVFEHFVAPDDVIGIDPDGDGDAILDACRTLIANGARQIVVALPRSAATHEDESRVRAVIRARYPEHYLRSVPLQLSTDVTASGEDEVRTATAIVNAYLHRDMAHLLARAEQELRAIGLDVPVLVVHASSGVARVATSVAVGTYSAGPSAGLSGAEHVARRLGDRLVLTADMGGTTLDLGIVTDGRCEVDVRPSIAGVRVALPMNRTESYGTGGGSLIGVAGDGTITVGPGSAGAVPGPAAFGRGGRRATVTDVDVVAGLLGDGTVLGGEVTLSGTAARTAVAEIADALGVSVEAAAAQVETAIDGQVGRDMGRFLASRSIDSADVTLYGFGGAGPVHFARAAGMAGIRRLRTFPYGAVFSAFGCTAVDVRHRYEVLIPTGEYALDAACEAVGQLVRRAGWDLSAEGFQDRAGTCQLVIEGVDGRQQAVTPDIAFGPGVARSLVESAWPLPANASTLALVVNVPIGELAGTPSSTLSRAAGTSSPGGERTIWWDAVPTTARVIEVAELQADRATPGPLLVLDGEAVCVVPPDWTVRPEADGSLLWERAG